jgi:hypothetical protein
MPQASQKMIAGFSPCRRALSAIARRTNGGSRGLQAPELPRNTRRPSGQGPSPSPLERAEDVSPTAQAWGQDASHDEQPATAGERHIDCTFRCSLRPSGEKTTSIPQSHRPSKSPQAHFRLPNLFYRGLGQNKRHLRTGRNDIYPYLWLKAHWTKGIRFPLRPDRLARSCVQTTARLSATRKESAGYGSLADARGVAAPRMGGRENTRLTTAISSPHRLGPANHH